MNDKDHELALSSFRKILSIVWNIMTEMNAWTNASCELSDLDVDGYATTAKEIQSQLCLMYEAISEFPKESLTKWKSDVFSQTGNRHDDIFMDVARRDVEGQPEGAAAACDNALSSASATLDEMLIRLGAGGFEGIVSAWGMLRNKLYVTVKKLEHAIEQLTMNPIFGSRLRERALRDIVASAEVASVDESSFQETTPKNSSDAETSLGLDSNTSNVMTNAKEDSDAETCDVLSADSDDGGALAEDDDDDANDSIFTDITIIPVDRRSKPITKAEAVRRLRPELNEDAGRRWLNNCIRDKIITCVRMTRQSYIFDICQVPENIRTPKSNSG